ncbi:MAG: recombinase zinc beta ribbon domain-containing protein, partial [Solirubrobacteraceae bacterium]
MGSTFIPASSDPEGLSAAVVYLHGQAPANPRDGKAYVWTAATTRRMLARAVYLGHISHADGRLGKRDAHDPLTTIAVWTAAQSAPAARAGSADFPLSGSIRCASCGAPMTGARGGVGQLTYRCGKRCAQAAVVTADRVEAYVTACLRERLTDLVIKPNRSVDLAELEAKLAEAGQELETFASDLTARRILGDHYHGALQTRADAVEALRQEHEQAAAASIQEELLAPIAELRPEWIDDHV